MSISPPRPGYTLPVFACASAIASLRYLHGENELNSVSFNLLEPPQTVNIEIEQVARLNPDAALAITRSDPGDNLDLTRNTPIWALVTRKTGNQELEIKGGEGIGIQVNNQGKSAIYSYAERLLRENLTPLLLPQESITVTIILPEGKKLATRTSNAAFGVVEGLSLLGTSGISQPLSAPGQLEIFREELQNLSRRFDSLVFCVGENGLDLAPKMGINPQILVKTANWIGPMLVEAQLQGISRLLLFGYHGKLIKLAGGIFHTHHHLADGRLEILTAVAAKMGLGTPQLQEILQSSTTEKGLEYLRQLDQQTGDNWVERIYGEIANTIDRRCQEYVYHHSNGHLNIGCILFDRSRSVITKSENGIKFLQNLQISPQ
jgi:cobalt-precorrin-5B (C1)-methyltransferase